MNNTVKALIFKFVMTFVISYISLGLIVRNPINWILSYAIIVTALNYMAGDLLILPSFGNITASIADGLMAALIAYIIGANSNIFDTNSASLVVLFALIVVGEYYFHQYLLEDEEVAP